MADAPPKKQYLYDHFSVFETYPGVETPPSYQMKRHLLVGCWWIVAAFIIIPTLFVMCILYVAMNGGLS